MVTGSTTVFNPKPELGGGGRLLPNTAAGAADLMEISSNGMVRNSGTRLRSVCQMCAWRRRSKANHLRAAAALQACVDATALEGAARGYGGVDSFLAAVWTASEEDLDGAVRAPPR